MKQRKHDCNRCDARCGGDVMRDKFGNFKHFLLCKGQVKPEPLRVPLLVELFEKGQSKEVLSLLNLFNINIYEKSRYPYFKLTYRKAA